MPASLSLCGTMGRIWSQPYFPLISSLNPTRKTWIILKYQTRSDPEKTNFKELKYQTDPDPIKTQWNRLQPIPARINFCFKDRHNNQYYPTFKNLLRVRLIHMYAKRFSDYIFTSCKVWDYSFIALFIKSHYNEDSVINLTKFKRKEEKNIINEKGRLLISFNLLY